MILTGIQRILIVRRDNIGDLICTTPAIAALRRHYPTAELAALVNTYNAEVLSGNPNLDKVFVYQKIKHATGFFLKVIAIYKRFSLIIGLRRWAPDVVILVKAGYDRHGLDFARRIRPKRIIGFLSSSKDATPHSFETSVQSPRFVEIHEVEAINKLLSPLGIYDALGPLEVFPDTNLVAKIQERLRNCRSTIAIHISAREQERRWGVENYLSLTNYLISHYPNNQVMLLWSPGDTKNPHHPGDDTDALKIISLINDDRLCPIPTQSIRELIAALSLCDLFIGADGGAMHLAVALNKKVVSLFENSPGKLAHWYPWKVSHKVVYSPSSSLPEVRNISQVQVKAAISDLL